MPEEAQLTYTVEFMIAKLNHGAPKKIFCFERITDVIAELLRSPDGAQRITCQKGTIFVSVRLPTQSALLAQLGARKANA